MTPLALLFTLLTLGLQAAAVPLAERTSPLLPSDDPFYVVPDNVRHVQPGAILRHRKPPAPIAAFGLLKSNIKDSHQILYRTTDSHDNATATVLTVLVPHNADYTKLLSYQVAEDAPTFNCAPSYAFQLSSATGGLLGTIITQAELILVQSALEQGWVVIVPDFQGPNGAFLANKLAGQAILDGVRAAIQSSDMTGISTRPTIALWGYSGGGITSGTAAELHATYAPELEIAGVAIGGLEPQIPTVIGKVNRTPFAGLIGAGMVGLANEYPVMANLINKQLKPKYRNLFHKIKQQCLVANSLDFLGRDIHAMFDGPDITTLPEAVAIMDQNAMGKAAPKAPLFIYKSVFDEVSPIRETDALYDFYCAHGASVQYERDILSEHGLVAVTAAPRALSFLIDVMNGRTPRKGCSKKTVLSSLLDPAAVKILPQFLLDALLDLIGKPIGPAFFG
jgi:hypothetical protein